MCKRGTNYCKQRVNAISLVFTHLTIICEYGSCLLHFIKCDSGWPNIMGNFWRAFLWDSLHDRQCISMEHQAMSNDSSCPTTCYNGRLYAGLSSRERHSTTFGVFLKPILRMRLWLVFTASKKVGVVRLYNFWGVMSVSIIH